MKKIVSVILVLFLLCGCASGKTNIKPVIKGISFGCEISYYNEVYECDCTVQNNGDMEMVFNTPSGIEGLKFSFTKNGVSANFKDIEYISQKNIFENSAANFVCEVLSNSDSHVLKDDDVFYIEGATDEFDYRLEFGATGLPIKITTRNQAVIVVFKNVKINKTN